MPMHTKQQASFSISQTKHSWQNVLRRDSDRRWHPGGSLRVYEPRADKERRVWEEEEGIRRSVIAWTYSGSWSLYGPHLYGGDLDAEPLDRRRTVSAGAKQGERHFRSIGPPAHHDQVHQISD